MIKQPNDASDDWRSGKTTAERGYGGRWQKARLTFLQKNPLCVYCRDQGKVVAATVVDHKVPHKGDQSLFWDRSNWQPLCAQCHSSAKQRIEKSGVTFGCNADGSPIDPNHHWAK